jgi:predicted transcriptional regulator
LARLGELERAVMEVLWSTGQPRTARQVADALPDRELAKTTVLTVLSRLEAKGRVERCRDEWAHTYVPTASREDYIAELMHEALGDAPDRAAALVRFAGQVSPDEAAALQDALDEALRRSGRGKAASSKDQAPIAGGPNRG